MPHPVKAAQTPRPDRMETTKKEGEHLPDVAHFINYRGEKIMKLNLLFIVMDVLTLLAYPIVFIYSKMYQFSKVKESTT
jgi:hypothetical protein